MAATVPGHADGQAANAPIDVAFAAYDVGVVLDDWRVGDMYRAVRWDLTLQFIDAFSAARNSAAFLVSAYRTSEPHLHSMT